MAAVTPKIRVADPVYNAGVICERLEEAYAKGAKIIVFPELCITGYTCGAFQSLTDHRSKVFILADMGRTRP